MCTGTIVRSRLVAVIEAEQRAQGEYAWRRNDRLLAVPLDDPARERLHPRPTWNRASCGSWRVLRALQRAGRGGIPGARHPRLPDGGAHPAAGANGSSQTAPRDGRRAAGAARDGSGHRAARDRAAGHRRRPAGTGLRASVLGIFGFAVLYALVPRIDRSEAFDLAVTMKLQSLRYPTLERVMGTVSWPGFRRRAGVRCRPSSSESMWLPPTRAWKR